jgi:curved DNA-binding protein CbpA
MDDFELLGVNADSSPDVIKKAYRSLAKKYHPDVAGGSAESHEKFVEINAAFDRVNSGNPIRKPGVRKAASSTRKWTPPDFGKETGETSRSRRETRQDDSSASTRGARQSSTSSSSDQQARSQRNSYSRGEAPKYTRQTRQQDKGPDENRDERVARAAQEKAQREASKASQQKTDYPRQERAGAPTSYAQEVEMQPTQKEDMQKVLEKRMQQEAYRRVTQMTGVYPDPRRKINTDRGDLPGFHMVDKISFKDGRVQLHLTGDAKSGRNIIAMPELSKTQNNSVRQGREIRLVDISAETAGKQSIHFTGRDNMKFEVLFGQERQKARTSAQDARV